MPFVELYNFELDDNFITVYRDDVNLSLIDYVSESRPGFANSQPPANIIVNSICIPGTFDQYNYKTQLIVPYAFLEIRHNAPDCGYVPPACDIMQKSFTKTDQTTMGVDDGTANLFCTSSFGPITYDLSIVIGGFVGGAIATNTTGLFTGLAPGDYNIQALDANGCFTHVTFTIEVFDTTKTHYKYRLLFSSIDELTNWELKLIDVHHNYDNTLYPKDVTGAGEPVIKKIEDPNEDKTTPIISKQLTINLIFTGNDFILDEFIVPEQSWKVELYKNGEIDFQGWLLPDEAQNEYSDAPYAVILTATDGLPSLKGNLFGNGSGGNGFGNLQIQQYGLTKWCKLVQQCLNQIGYNYGASTFLTSLQYAGAYDENLFTEIGCWSDILYDSSGVALDTYSALSLLLTGLKLCIFQHKGYFIFINWNDLYYINNGLRTADFQQAIYQMAADFNSIIATGVDVEQPVTQLIGKDYPFRPANPPQDLNYDKAYNIEEDASFDRLALLYENPSFEIGPVQGDLPPGWDAVGPIPFVFCNYDPLDPANPLAGAADGSWELRSDWLFSTTDSDVLNNYATLHDPIVIDQPGLKVNLSFQWRPKQVPGMATNTVPGYLLVFIDGTSGHEWVFASTGSPPRWIRYTEPPSGGQIANIQHPSVFTNGDYTSWQTYGIQTTVLPESGVGTLNYRVYPPNYYFVGSFATDGTRMIADIDLLDISVTSANPDLINQTSEKHITTAVTGIPYANLKQSDIDLFTYPPNKRVAGNIFFGSDYATAIVANTWNFALKKDPQARLPAAITKAIARNYSRQMYKLQGSVKANDLSFFGIFQLQYYDSKIFTAFSIEALLKSGICNLTLIENDDSDAQNVYTYTPVYQRSARNNG